MEQTEDAVERVAIFRAFEELQPYILEEVVPTNRDLGKGSYGYVEEVSPTKVLFVCSWGHLEGIEHSLETLWNQVVSVFLWSEVFKWRDIL